MLPPPLPETGKPVVCVEQLLGEVFLYLCAFLTCGASVVWVLVGGRAQALLGCCLKYKLG